MAASEKSAEVEAVGAGGIIPYRWELMILFWFAYFFNQADRQIYGVVLPLIREDLGLDDFYLGLVASIFTWSYGILVPVGGYAGDVLRRKWVVFSSLLVWSAATLFTGLSTCFGHLVAFRGVTTGGGEAFYYPSANSLIGQFHHRTRALAMSIHQTSLYVGIVASGLVAGYIGQTYGWRYAFLVFGALGLALAVVIVVRLKDTPQPQPVDAAVKTERIPISTVLREVLRKPTVIMLSLAFACMVFVNIGFLTWMPTLLVENFGLTVTDAGFSSMFYHHIFAFIGVLVGGRLSDLWASRRRTVRMEVECAGLLLGAPFIYLMGTAGSLILCYGALAGFGLFRGIYDSNLFAALFDVIEPRLRASAVGIMISFAFIVGALAPLILGWAKKPFGLSAGIAGLSVAYLLGAAIIFAATKLFFRKDYCEAAT
jgi:MFS family permease